MLETCPECGGEFVKHTFRGLPATPYCVDHVDRSDYALWIAECLDELEREKGRLAVPSSEVDLSHPLVLEVLCAASEGAGLLVTTAKTSGVPVETALKVLAAAGVPVGGFRSNRGRTSDYVDQARANEVLFEIKGLRSPRKPAPRPQEQKELVPMDEKKLMTTAQVAVHFGVTTHAVLAWKRKGCPVVRPGKRGVSALFDLEEVKAWRKTSNGRPGRKPRAEPAPEAAAEPVAEEATATQVAEARQATPSEPTTLGAGKALAARALYSLSSLAARVADRLSTQSEIRS